MGWRQNSSATAGLSFNGMALPNSLFSTFIAQCFTRYRIIGGLKLHYEPQAVTSDPTRFNLAFTNDYYHPTVGERAYQLGVPPNSAVLDDSPNAIAFASWNAWSAEFPMLSEWRYNYAWPAYGTNTFTDEERLNFFGALSVIVNGSTVSGYATVGRLYWDFEVEFADPYPIITASFASYFVELDRKQARLRARSVAAPTEESKEARPEDESVTPEDLEHEIVERHRHAPILSSSSSSMSTSLSSSAPSPSLRQPLQRR